MGTEVMHDNRFNYFKSLFKEIQQLLKETEFFKRAVGKVLAGIKGGNKASG